MNKLRNGIFFGSSAVAGTRGTIFTGSPGYKSWTAKVFRPSGSAAVSATFEISATNVPNPTEGDWDPLATVSLSGSGIVSGNFACEAPYNSLSGKLLACSGVLAVGIIYIAEF